MISIKHTLNPEQSEEYNKAYNLIINSCENITPIKVERLIPKYVTLGTKKFKSNFPKENEVIARIIKKIEELNISYTSTKVPQEDQQKIKGKILVTPKVIESKMTSTPKLFDKLQDPAHVDTIKTKLLAKKLSQTSNNDPEVYEGIVNIMPSYKPINSYLPLKVSTPSVSCPQVPPKLIVQKAPISSSWPLLKAQVSSTLVPSSQVSSKVLISQLPSIDIFSPPGGISVDKNTRAEGEPENVINAIIQETSTLGIVRHKINPKADLVSIILKSAIMDDPDNYTDNYTQYQKYHHIFKNQEELDNSTILEIKDRRELTDIGIKMGPAIKIMKQIEHYKIFR